MKHEAGGHRIQRVPPTEKRGRVHTSTVTVSVLSDDATPSINPQFRARWFSGTGKGGQHRNKHQNCCELIDAKTGLSRTGQSSRSRDANYREAEAALVADLQSRETGKAGRDRNATRKQQIGAGMRGDKRRTYRFQDDSVVDHFTGKRAKASVVMKGGFDLLWA